MMPALLNPDPLALPLREIHLPESVGWWPPAPGWWLLTVLLALGFAAVCYARLLYRRRQYSAVNMARRELAEIRSRYAADQDAVRCARAISGLLRRLSISVFPPAQSAGLTGAEWLAFLRSGRRKPATDNSGAGFGWFGSRPKKTETARAQQLPESKEQCAQDALPEHTGRLLLEAPYRRSVSATEVEDLIGFCADWIESVAQNFRQLLR